MKEGGDCYDEERRIQQVIAAISRNRTSNQASVIQGILGRFFIRLLRILFGCVVLLIALWLLSGAKDISDTPFANLSLKLVGVFIFDGSAGLWLLICAWTLAFGAAPTAEEIEQKTRSKAMQLIKNGSLFNDDGRRQ